MSYLSRAAKGIKLIFSFNEKRDLPTDRNKLSQTIFKFHGGLITAENLKMKDFVRKGYRGNPDVYAIVSLKTKRASSIPWFIYELRSERDKKKYNSAISAKDFQAASYHQTKAWEQVEVKGLQETIERPNEIQSWSEFIEESVGYRSVTGNSYIYGMSTLRNGVIDKLYNLPAHMVSIKLKENGNYFNQENREYILDMDYQYPFSGEEVLHLKYWNPAEFAPDFLYGLSPIKAASMVLTKSNDSYLAGASALRNMGVNGILSQDASLNDPDGPGWLTEEEATEMKKKFRNKYTGPENFQDVMLTSAAVKWTNMGMSPVDLALIEQQKMDLKTLCNIYQMPVQLLNSEEASTYNNVEAMERAMYVNCVIPELQALRNGLNKFLIEPWAKKTGRKLWIDFDIRSIPALQTDLEKLRESGLKMVMEGAITRNMFLEMIGMDRISQQPEIMDAIILPSKYKDKVTTEKIEVE